MAFVKYALNRTKWKCVSLIFLSDNDCSQGPLKLYLANNLLFL